MLRPPRQMRGNPSPVKPLRPGLRPQSCRLQLIPTPLYFCGISSTVARQDPPRLID